MTYDLNQLTRPLKVSKRIQETPDAVSLCLQVPAGAEKEFRFGPGQFLTLFLNINGETVPRSYSICSAPGIDPELKVTIKRVPGGRGSNFVCDHVKVGDELRVSPPSGRFYQPAKGAGPHHYVLAAAGSGITPIFSILKTVLMTEPGSRVTLVYSNRKPESVIYAGELKAWQTRLGERLKVHHVFTQPPGDWSGWSGRCQGNLLRTIVKDILATKSGPVESYLCGPVDFMANWRSELIHHGVASERIHQESFVPASAVTSTITADPNGTYIGDASATWTKTESEVEVTLNGEKIQLSVNKDQTIVEALIAKSENPPYSCLEGNCMACVAKIRKGRVVQKDPGILLDENIEAGEVLTCQARPASDLIHIDYDSI